jgi:DedD protein
VSDSKEGKRTRVRVGPFANKAEADQAALKIKALDLPATILSL